MRTLSGLRWRAASRRRALAGSWCRPLALRTVPDVSSCTHSGTCPTSTWSAAQWRRRQAPGRPLRRRWPRSSASSACAGARSSALTRRTRASATRACSAPTTGGPRAPPPRPRCAWPGSSGRAAGRAGLTFAGGRTRGRTARTPSPSPAPPARWRPGAEKGRLCCSSTTTLLPRRLRARRVHGWRRCRAWRAPLAGGTALRTGS
mmetsp:Transcript_7204/g.22532  ORF Transcript_7204/g.22532 Transcript_7204/m.22532 type:complete len:204 (+) Transcript_7204:917-1528(+)